MWPELYSDWDSASLQSLKAIAKIVLDVATLRQSNLRVKNEL